MNCLKLESQKVQCFKCVHSPSIQSIWWFILCFCFTEASPTVTTTTVTLKAECPLLEPPPQDHALLQVLHIINKARNMNPFSIKHLIYYILINR